MTLKTSPPKVLVAVPTTGKVDTKFVASLINILVNAPKGTPYAFDWSYGVAESRNRLVQQAMQMQDVSHILFVDDDIVVQEPTNLIDKMLSYEKPILSGIYQNSFGTGLAAWIDEKPLSISGSELRQVDKVGLGLCLIDKKVFAEIDPPWFMYEMIDDERRISEDFYFFGKCREKGVKPYMCSKIKGLHIKEYLISPDNYNP